MQVTMSMEAVKSTLYILVDLKFNLRVRVVTNRWLKCVWCPGRRCSGRRQDSTELRDAEMVAGGEPGANTQRTA